MTRLCDDWVKEG